MIFPFIPQAYAATIPGTNWVTKGCADDSYGVTAVTIKGIECIFQNLLSQVPALLALVVVGMLIMAGVRLIGSGSDPKALAAAWKTFTWAIIGLVLMAVAWLVIVLVERFTGASLSTFGIPTL